LQSYDGLGDYDEDLSACDKPSNIQRLLKQREIDMPAMEASELELSTLKGLFHRAKHNV
jgi:hypothetical protein